MSVSRKNTRISQTFKKETTFIFRKLIVETQESAIQFKQLNCRLCTK